MQRRFICLLALCTSAILARGGCSPAYGLAAQYTLTVLGPTQVRGNPTIATAIAPDGATIVGDLTGGVDYNSAVEFTPIAQALSTPVSGAFDVEEGAKSFSKIGRAYVEMDGHVYLARCPATRWM